MDTKWKKSKYVVGFLLFVICMSMLIFNAVTLGNRLFDNARCYSGKQQLLGTDYQNTWDFQNFMEQRLETFLSMGVGQGTLGIYSNSYGYDENWASYAEEFPDDYDYDDYVMEYGTEDDVVSEGEASYATSGQYDAYENAGTIVYSDVDEYPKDTISKEDLKKAADRFDQKIKEDKNLLYKISYEGQVLYSNMDDVVWNQVGDALPEQYNYVLHYHDGTVDMIKDGKEIDVYHDGVYHEDQDWSVPGYQNFTVDDDVKKVDVVMIAAKNPVLYTQAKNETKKSYGFYSNLYDLNSSLQSRNAECKVAVKLVGIGLAGVIISLFLWKEKKHTVQKTGKILAMIPFELKLLAIVVSVFYDVLRDSYLYDGYYDFQNYQVYYMEDFMWSITRFLENIVFSPMLLLLLLWEISLLVIDLKENKNIFKNSISYKIFKVLQTKILHLSFTKKWMKRTRILLLVQLLSTIAAFILVIYGVNGCIHELVIVTVIMWIVIFVISNYIYSKQTKKQAVALDLLSHQIEDIKDGKTQVEVDGLLNEELGNMSTNLKDIHQGMEVAIEERIKSEHMKVALLTNISHDIKTPLTSIVSYVDLLKEEENLPEHVKDYIRILEQKSLRLKSMINDVFEVSKATSGQLPVMMETIDFGKLLEQTMADMQEQITQSTVQVKLQIPEQRVMINADGRRMYRVFQNLLQNALKYSLDGSRVYVSLTTEGEMAIAQVSSTSKDELSQDVDFTERFVRGDDSRTDGGSGLGLSIAQSFTEACQGKFEIITHADLFVAKVSFSKIVVSE